MLLKSVSCLMQLQKAMIKEEKTDSFYYKLGMVIVL